MKKTLTIVALSALFVGALFADGATNKSPMAWMDNLSLKSSVGFESEYVYRGKNLAHNVTIWTLQGSYKLYKGNLYAGTIGYNGTSATYTEQDIYVGYKMPIDEKFSLDVGYTYYWYPNQSLAPTIDRTNEVYAGVMYNGLYVNPAAYIYYDIDLEQIIVELSGKYSWDLAKYGWANTSFDVGGYVGWLNSDDTNGSQVDAGASNGYTYWGVTADLVYALTKNASVSAGLRYVGNDDEADKVTTGIAAREDNFGWGFKFSAGF